MNRAAHFRRDAVKLLQLIRNMRRAGTPGAVGVPDKWFVQYCLESQWWALTADVLKEIPTRGELCVTAADAWLQCLQQPIDRDAARGILAPFHDASCVTLMGYISIHHAESAENKERGLQLLTQQYPACAEATFILGVREMGNGHVNDALQYYQRAIEMKHPGAIYFYACIRVEFYGACDEVIVAMLEHVALQGHAEAYVTLGTLYHYGPTYYHRTLAAHYYRAAYVRGSDLGLEELEKMPREDAIPWGEWCTEPLMNDFTPLNIKSQMKTLLLMHAREGTLVSLLPMHLIMDVCEYICTR